MTIASIFHYLKHNFVIFLSRMWRVWWSQSKEGKEERKQEKAGWKDEERKLNNCQKAWVSTNIIHLASA